MREPRKPFVFVTVNTETVPQRSVLGHKLALSQNNLAFTFLGRCSSDASQNLILGSVLNASPKQVLIADGDSWEGKAASVRDFHVYIPGPRSVVQIPDHEQVHEKGECPDDNARPD